MRRVLSHIPYRGPRHNRRGFAVAAILYMLGLIGVIGGVIYSGNMQSIRSVLTVQNSLTVRSDLQAASNTLSAEAVLGTDNQTLCPPRSVHETSDGVCATAAIALVQFADLTSTTQLPANYANAASSGSPVEVGVFGAGAGVKQLDPYGHYYIYCRWENPRSVPAASAFVILTAGPDGSLQSNCGSATAQGDDTFTLLTVGVAINRAALWQSGTSDSVSYGATGSKVTVDSSGDLTAAGAINALSASITDGITAATLTTTGDIHSKDLIAFDNVIGTTGSFLDITTGSITVSGAATISGTTTLGALNAQSSTLNSLTVTNSATLNGGLSVNGGDLVLANGYSYAQIDSIGNSRRLIALSPENDILLGGHNGTGNIYFLTNNSTVGYVDVEGDLDMIGSIVGANGVFSGNVTAANVTATTGNITTLSAGNTTISGTASITGTLTGSSASFSGIVSAAGFSSSAPVSFNGGASISGGNLNAGNANLGATTVSSLTDSGFLTVSGVSNLNGGVFVSGGLTANSGASMNSYLNVNGPAILNNLVGIGTNNPQAPLDIYQSSGSYMFLRDSQSGFKLISSSGGNYIESAGAGMAGAAPLSITDMNGIHTWLSFTSSGTAEFMESVGIGTASPAATLDINGFMRLAKNTSAPATCSASNDGAIALTHIYTLCVCKNGTGWVTASTGTTACSF